MFILPLFWSYRRRVYTHCRYSVVAAVVWEVKARTHWSRGNNENHFMKSQWHLRTRQPDSTMWHIQFYGSIYDPPLRKGTHVPIRIHSLFIFYIAQHSIICFAQFHVNTIFTCFHRVLFRFRPHSTPSAHTHTHTHFTISEPSQVNSLNQTNAFCTYFRKILFPRHRPAWHVRCPSAQFVASVLFISFTRMVNKYEPFDLFVRVQWANWIRCSLPSCPSLPI